MLGIYQACGIEVLGNYIAMRLSSMNNLPNHHGYIICKIYIIYQSPSAIVCLQIYCIFGVGGLGCCRDSSGILENVQC